MKCGSKYDLPPSCNVTSLFTSVSGLTTSFTQVEYFQSVHRFVAKLRSSSPSTIFIVSSFSDTGISVAVFPLLSISSSTFSLYQLVVYFSSLFPCSTKSYFLSQSSGNIFAFKSVNNNRNIPFQEQRGQIAKIKLFYKMVTAYHAALTFK